MIINTNTLVSITEANQNFSKVARQKMIPLHPMKTY